MTRIEHRPTPRADEFQPLVETLIDDLGIESVCEVGGGRTPMLSGDFVSARGVSYLVIDVSAEELAKAPPHVETMVGDISDPDFSPLRRFDLVVTRWVLEHVRKPRSFHAGVGRLLRPAGKAVHLFPTLYALPFAVNMALPDRLTTRLLRSSGRDRREQAKFPAHYRWCRGPSRRQLRRLEYAGFDVEEYVGLFGHRYYQRLPTLQRAEDRLARALAHRGVNALTSYAWVVLSKTE